MPDENDYEDKTMVMAPRAAKKLATAPKARLKCTKTALLGIGPGAEIVLDGNEITVGRGRENTVALQAEGISRRHARFSPGARGWTVEDLGSTNGIRVNGQKTGKAELAHGDKIDIGGVPFSYSVDSDAASTIESEASFTTVPAARKPATAASAAPGSAPAQPRTGSKPAKSGESNAVLWLIVLLGAAALGIGVYFVLV